MSKALFSLSRRFLAAALCLGLLAPALAATTTYRVQPPGGKIATHDMLRAPAGSIPAASVSAMPVRAEEIQAVREENSSRKRLVIGVGRDILDTPLAGSTLLQWSAVPGGMVAHWQVTSAGAAGVRIGLDVARLAYGAEIRFSGSGSDVAYGPFTSVDVATAAGGLYWSPALEGETGTVEIFTPDTAGPAFSSGIRVARVSHLFVSPMNPRVGSLAKTSGACEVDLVCLSASDPALANTGKATAKMTITDGSGNTGLCTGTLLNSVSPTAQPYFFTANHCFNPSGRGSQANASSITTIWSYDRSSCGGGSVSSVQVGGGARLLYAEAPTDVLFLRLNRPPPAGAVFSGWDSSVVSTGTRLWAVHHPAGDVKKVSLGSMGGYANNISGSPGTLLMTVLWDGTATGVVEGGSSGSGVFSAVGSPASEYRLRGGLFGGPSSCAATGTALRDYYSRLDTNYAYLDQYLNPSSTCAQTLSASTLNVAGEGGSASLSVTTTGSCGWSAASEVDWVSTSSAAIGSGTAQFTVSPNITGASRTGTLIVGKQTVTVVQPASTSPSSELLINPGFESGSASWVQNPTNIIGSAAANARSGSGFAWLSGYNNANDLLYQQVTIPSDATSAIFSFWYRITTEDLPAGDFDKMVVTIDNASGTPLGSIVTLSNRNATSGWVQSASYDLSAFRGQTIRVTFRATSDASLITSFLVDDVSLAITRAASSAFQATGLWWNSPAGSESGWGINFTQQGDKLFGTLFTYDASGNPLWLVMSDGQRQGTADTFSGVLYRTTGPVFNAVPFNSGQVTVTPQGTMSVAFQSNGTGTLTYTFNGVTVTKTIVRQIYGSRAATCTSATGSRAGLTNYQDLWWNPSESGWGINLTHQDQTLFGTLFTYDATGRDLWLVMSAGVRQADGSYLGELYRTTGPAFNATPFNSSQVAVTPVGTMRLSFTNGETGTLVYSVNGATVTKSITRQVFSSPLPSCAS